jgi:DNA-binding NarL/FixJ family response regulator
MSTVLPDQASAAIGCVRGGGGTDVIRVLLADDHHVFREGLREILEGEGNVAVEGEASDAASTLALVRRTRADVLLLDLSMPGRGGIELIRTLRDAAPALKILVLTMHDERHFALRAFMAGAQGYLTKHGAASELSAALKKVAAGGVYVGPWMADFVAQNLAAPPQTAPHQQLTDREFDIFLRLARGENAADIAQALSLSAKTVANYKAQIFRTMRFTSEAALVRYAMSHQLIDDNDVF